jgi:hypothetical protein
MKESLTIAIQCHNFQKRLCFMLSSLCQQKHLNCDLVVDISYLKNNGKPSTEEVIALFREKGLNIKETVYDSVERFQFRGYTRNDQLATCNTDYMLFADTDMVYHPRFFNKLFKTLEEEQYANYNGMYICGRYSQPNEIIEKSNTFVNLVVEDKALYVNHAWTKCDVMLTKKSRSSVGAGYFQLIHMDRCDHGGYYVPEGKSRDRGWEGSGQKAKSDMQFRRRLKHRIQLPRWFGKAQIHVNHFRDNQFGRHLTEQR